MSVEKTPSRLIIGKVLPPIQNQIDAYSMQIPLLFYPFEAEIYNQIPFNASLYLQYFDSKYFPTSKFKLNIYAFLPLKVKLESEINLDYSSKLMEQDIDVWKKFYKDTQKNLRILHNIYEYSIQMISKIICDRGPTDAIDVLSEEQNRVAKILVLLNVILFNSRLNIIYLETKNASVNDSCLVFDFRTQNTPSAGHSVFQPMLDKLQFLNTLGGVLNGVKTHIPVQFLTVLPMDKIQQYDSILEKYIATIL